jgi:ribosomal-protein-alanine N-acetyltransferase
VIRDATAEDLPLVRDLWREFGAEVPDEPWRPSDADEDLARLEDTVGNGVVLLAERDGEPVGLAWATLRGERLGFLEALHVRPRARRAGVATELVRAVVSRLGAEGVEMLELEVLASNEAARAIYERWGMRPVELTVGARVDELSTRLEPAAGPTFGSVHAQTDDVGAVEREVQKVLPRMGRSAGTSVTGPRDGWVVVHDDLCDREPIQLQRLARELSYSLPAITLAIGVERGSVVRYTLYDRGSSVDEYLSVPTFYGELPPGDVVALGSNPTVVARLTGADPRRVREVARTAATPGELPPPIDLLREIADVMRIAEADHGWDGGAVGLGAEE